LRNTVIASGTLTILAVIIIGSHPVEAGSCQAVVAEGRGANEAKASARAQKHLTFKINRWARRTVTPPSALASQNPCAQTRGPFITALPQAKFVAKGATKPAPQGNLIVV